MVHAVEHEIGPREGITTREGQVGDDDARVRALFEHRLRGHVHSS
jgi:hypothetical protein